MKSGFLFWFVLTAVLPFQIAHAAPFMRPPAFMGGIPGKAQFQAIQMQRHQARTLLYREALEELRKNPQAADVPECPSDEVPKGLLCLVRAKPVLVEPTLEVTTKPEVAARPETVPVVPVVQAPVIEPEHKIAKVEKPPIVRRRFAVLFGNNDYKDPIPALDTPIADVEGIANVLKNQYGFKVKVIRNAGKAGIVEELNAVAIESTPEDSVLLFYAGHGYLMDETKMGYWIPVDASVKTAKGWISNQDISKLLSAINARQLILVSDSCFSGSLTKEQKIVDIVASGQNDIWQRRSVIAFSSGGEEPVSDEGKEGHSIFAWSLINTLQSAKGIAPGYEIYRTVHSQVTKDFPQAPQYGAVISAGHNAGGEYLFENSKF